MPPMTVKEIREKSCEQRLDQILALTRDVLASSHNAELLDFVLDVRLIVLNGPKTD